MRTLNKKGPRTDPWGASVMGCVEKPTSPTITYCFLLDRNLLNNYLPYVIIYDKLSCKM